MGHDSSAMRIQAAGEYRQMEELEELRPEPPPPDPTPPVAR